MGVDWPGRWVGEAAVVSGVAWSARAGVLGLSFSGFRVLPVCSRLWMTAAVSAASVWAARPNARQESFSKLPSSLSMPLIPFDGVASGVVGCPLRGAVGVALVVVEFVDTEGDHPVAAVFAVGDGGDGQGGAAVGPFGVAGSGCASDVACALGAYDLLPPVGEASDDYPCVFGSFVEPFLAVGSGQPVGWAE